VSGIGNRSRNLRTRSDKTSDQEERRLRVVAGEDLEQTLGVNVVWTVVISESQVLGIREVSCGAAVKLRLGRVAVVREITRTGEYASNS